MEVKRKEKDKTNTTRGEAGNLGENGTVNGEPTSEPFSFSSDRFAFSDDPEDDATVECINNSRHMFAEFRKKRFLLIRLFFSSPFVFFFFMFKPLFH